MREYCVTLKTDGGYIFNFYTWAFSKNMARDTAKRASDCQIVGSWICG